jgi:hypothetical protein
MKIIVGVIACDSEGYDKMVQAARETCYKSIPECFEVFYLYGHRNGVDIPRGGYKIEGDCFYYDWPEARNTILRKTVAFFEYCLENKDFDYMFRPNCGSYINYHLFEEFINKNKFSNEGVYFGTTQKIHMRNDNSPEYSHVSIDQPGFYFVSGAAYLISKDVVEFIVKNQQRLFYGGMNDDVAIGQLLNGRVEVNNIESLVPMKKNDETLIKLRKMVNYDDIIADRCTNPKTNDPVIDGECYHWHFRTTKDPRCFYEIHKRIIEGDVVI